MAMVESPVSWERVLNDVAAVVGVQPASNLDPRYSTLAAMGTRTAWLIYCQPYLAAGYAGSAIPTSDQAVTFVLLKATVLTLRLASVWANYSTETLAAIDGLERTAEQVLTVAGTPVAPGAGDSPVGGVSSGRLQAWEDEARRYDRQFGGGRGREDWW